VPSSTETAAANGDTRTLNLYHSHTGESIQATFRVNGSYDPAVLEKLNWFLRDWRNNDRTRMDPRLFDVIWEAYRTAGATEPIVIVSAYRSPVTNAMLRSRSHAVAEHSQHILGRAMDTTMPGMPMERIREIGMRLQRGGVGWYPSSNFVHLDVGGVRAWPRMSYDQLARLFPDGKTVHLAADGRALPRYEEARAEITSRGGVMTDVPQAAPSGGLFAWLFGKHDEEEEADAVRPQAVRPARARHGGTEVAALRMNGESPAGAAPANPVVLADRGNARAATAAPASAPGKNSPPNKPSPAEADRTRVADLGSAPSLRGTRAAIEQGRDERQERDAEAPEILQDKIDKRGASAASAPLPPPRPARPGDVAVAFADVPAPPARPASATCMAALAADQAQDKDGAQASKSVTKNETISDAAASSANSPLARAANLPVVITQGPKDRASVPKQVLAFASETPGEDPRGAAPSKTPGDTMSRPTTQPPVAAARLDRAKFRGLASDISTASFPAQSILGQSFTGLRRAARTIPDALSNRPSVDYVSAFRTTPSDLDPGHFTGAATKPLALAQGFVRITGSPVPLRGN
ncbi:MAG: DUF882 domain-containing protein, partial [Pseudomonadota bacterium]|nr:DUF882 domain-containing protein [Pseudomonadota bacterium]